MGTGSFLFSVWVWWSELTQARQQIVEWVACGAASLCVGIGLYVGKLSNEASHHVCNADFARVQQQVHSMERDVQTIRVDLKDIERNSDETVQLLRGVMRRDYEPKQ